MNVVLPFKPIEFSLPPQTCFDAIINRMEGAHATHLGYPYNLNGLTDVPEGLRGYLINNLGDPYAGSHYASEVCDLEREAVNWLMDLWECGNHDDYWGSIGASGTESNFGRFIWRARHSRRQAYLQPRGALLDPEGCQILRMEALCVCVARGVVDLAEFAKAAEQLGDATVIVALTAHHRQGRA